MPTLDDKTREKLVSAVNPGTKHISSVDRDTISKALTAFDENFEFVGKEPPWKEPSESEATGAPIAPTATLPARDENLFEVSDEVLKLPRYELFKHIAGTKLITSPSAYWTRGLRMRLWTALPAQVSQREMSLVHVVSDREYQALRSKLFHPVSPEATPITQFERDTVNAFLNHFVENYKAFQKECKELGIFEDHDQGVDFIFEVDTSDERAAERASMCRLLNSLYMRKSNAYWPQQLKKWVLDLVTLSSPEWDDKDALKMNELKGALGSSGPKYLTMEQKDFLFSVLKHRIQSGASRTAEIVTTH